MKIACIGEVMIELIGAVFGLIAIMASGWLADRFGRRVVLISSVIWAQPFVETCVKPALALLA